MLVVVDGPLFGAWFRKRASILVISVQMLSASGCSRSRFRAGGRRCMRRGRRHRCVGFRGWWSWLSPGVGWPSMDQRLHLPRGAGPEGAEQRAPAQRAGRGKDHDGPAAGHGAAVQGRRGPVPLSRKRSQPAATSTGGCRRPPRSVRHPACFDADADLPIPVGGNARTEQGSDDPSAIETEFDSQVRSCGRHDRHIAFGRDDD